MSSWIESAETALRGAVPVDGEVEVLRGGPPPVFDRVGRDALIASFVAVFAWQATIFRELQSGTPLDPLALLFRLLALAMSVRAIVLLWMLGRRVRLRFACARYGLVLTPEGLLYRTPDVDVAVPREDILEVRERGLWRDRGGRRFADVYVVTQPRSGRTHLALPPVFERTPGVLAERLMRWLGTSSRSEASDEPSEPSEPLATPADPQPATSETPLASELWERVARGERPSGVVAIAHGSLWLQRGPYASMLLGLAVLQGFVRLPAVTRAQIDITVPLVLIGALVVVPIGWLVITRRQLKPRLGLAAIMTPTELLLRTAAGVLRVPWTIVQRVDIESRTTWSLLLGAHEARSLLVHRRSAQQLRYQESFIGVPLEVIAVLCDAYRKARID
jgi:hypothetical protein